MTRRRGPLLLLAVAATVLAALWIDANMYLKEERISGTPKGEAASNDLYAAQLLLGSLGAQATSLKGYDAPPAGPPAGSVLILPTTRRTLSPTRHAELLDWVRAGGHLVVVTYTVAAKGDPPDPVMEAAGLVQTMADDDEDEADAQAPAGGAERSAAGSGCPVQSASGSGPRRFPADGLELCFDVRFSLQPVKGRGWPPLWVVGTDAAKHAVTTALGAGRITVLTDYNLLRNWDIGNADHADFLVAMLGPDIAGLRVAIVPREEVDGLAKLIWRHGAAVVVALLLLILVVLWSRAARLGPIAPSPVPERRSMVEHVEALGGFLWRQGAGAALWRAAAARTRRSVARRLPPYADEAAMAADLARRTQQDEAALRAALGPHDRPTTKEFTHAIGLLETVRRSL